MYDDVEAAPIDDFERHVGGSVVAADFTGLDRFPVAWIEFNAPAASLDRSKGQKGG